MKFLLLLFFFAALVLYSCTGRINSPSSVRLSPTLSHHHNNYDYEAWDEEVPCTHSYDCMCGTDKDGNSCCCSTCYSHAYDVDYHSEYWLVVDSNGASWTVTQNHYNYLVKKFGGKLDSIRTKYNLFYVSWKLPTNSILFRNKNEYGL